MNQFVDKLFQDNSPLLSRSNSDASSDEESQLDDLPEADELNDSEHTCTDKSWLGLLPSPYIAECEEGEHGFVSGQTTNSPCSTAFIYDEPSEIGSLLSSCHITDEPDSFDALDEFKGPQSHAPAVSSKQSTFSPMSRSLNSSNLKSLRMQGGSLRDQAPSFRTGSGRRKALLVGIQYKVTPLYGWDPLNAPFRDVRNIQKLLRISGAWADGASAKYGWHKDSFTVLLDDGGAQEKQPTYPNMIAEMKKLVKDARPDDRLFFYYSGHGRQVKDEDGDEEDGFDEAILTCDGQSLLDDTMHQILVKDLPEGCHLTAVFDCCSSGTGLDLPFSRVKGEQKEGCHARRKSSEGNVVLLAACADNEKARESRRGGLFTSNLIRILNERRESTLADIVSESGLHREDLLARKQTAQFSGSFELDMNSRFEHLLVN